ncbi:hypothetical protein D3C87_1533600 [compost metagenome]
MRKGIHTRSSGNKRGQFHGQHRIGKHNLCHKLWRKQNLFLMGFIVGNNRTAAYFAAGAGCSWNGNKMGHFVGYIHIAPNQIVVFKEVGPMAGAQ